MPDKQQIIDQAARIVKPGGKVMFTDWIEGEGLSDPEAQRFLSLMTFPAIPTVEEYADMLKKANFEVEIAEKQWSLLTCYEQLCAHAEAAGSLRCQEIVGLG